MIGDSHRAFRIDFRSADSLYDIEKHVFRPEGVAFAKYTLKDPMLAVKWSPTCVRDSTGRTVQASWKQERPD
jgi:hypothetical protein